MSDPAEMRQAAGGALSPLPYAIAPFYQNPMADRNGDGLITDNLVFMSEFPDLHTFIIRAAAARWEHLTNLDFREGDPAAEHQLLLQSAKPPGYYIGIAYDHTLIQLDTFFWLSASVHPTLQLHMQGLVMHELGHILGFWHVFDGTATVMDYWYYEEDPTAFDTKWTDYFYRPATVDSLWGADGADLLTGGAGAEVMSGAAGDDTLFGGADADRLYGGDGADVLYGNLDQDMLMGGAGNDTLFGGRDSDTLSGGDGDDVLFGNLGADLFLPGAGNNRIADFSAAEGDRIGGILVGKTDAESGAVAFLQNGGTVTLAGVQAADVQDQWFVNWLL
jgi:hypothetical protein